MAQWKRDEKGLAEISDVWPEYPAAHDMPKDPQDDPAFWKITNPKERDEFYDQWRAQEAAKRYKAIDTAGVVWLIQNPAVWNRTKSADGVPVILRPKPVRLGKVADYRRGVAGKEKAVEDAQY